MPDQRIGGVEDIAERAVILFEPDDVLDAELALELAHVADLGATEGVNALIVVADREQAGARLRRVDSGQQAQPAVLQDVGVLKFIDQDMAKARLVMPAQRLVTQQEFITAQQ